MKRTWVTAKQLAEEFGVNQETVYRAYRTGKLPGSQMGWNIRFDLDEVHAHVGVSREPCRRNRFLDLSQVDRMALFGVKRDLAGPICLFPGFAMQLHRVFLHVDLTCDGVARRPSSSRHLRPVDRHHAFYDFGPDERPSGE